jgi:hypothetical protein
MEKEKEARETEIERFKKNAAPRTIKMRAIKCVGLSGPGSNKSKIKAPGVVFLVNEEEAARLVRIKSAEHVKESTKLNTDDECEKLFMEHQNKIREEREALRQIEKQLREGSKG